MICAPSSPSFIFHAFISLQTSLVVFAYPGRAGVLCLGKLRLVTVLAFSCFTTTQCSMSSAMGGGNWLRIGGGIAATGCFFAARSKQNTSQAFLMPFVFAVSCPNVDGNLG